jgi:hypothetical protein
MSAILAFSLSLVLIADGAFGPTCVQPSAPLLTAWEECVESNSSEHEPSTVGEQAVADLAVDECAPLKRKYIRSW